MARGAGQHRLGVAECASVSLHPLRERKLYLAGKPAAEVRALGVLPGRPVSACVETRAFAHGRTSSSRHHIVMVTGSLDFLIAPLAALLEVPTLLAASLEQQQHRFTGHVCAPLPYGPGKRELIAQPRGIRY